MQWLKLITVGKLIQRNTNLNVVVKGRGSEQHLAGENPVGSLDLLERGVAADVQRGVVVLLSTPGHRRSPPERGGTIGPSAGMAGEAEREVELSGGESRRRLPESASGTRRGVWVCGGQEERGGRHGTGRRPTRRRPCGEHFGSRYR